MRWIERAFEPGRVLIRTFVLLFCLVGQFLFFEHGVNSRDWALALGALALSTLGRWSPLGSLLVQVGLLAAADLYGFAAVASMKVLACVLLFDLAIRRPARQVAVGAATLGTVVCVNLLDELPQQLPSVLFRISVVVGVPLLLAAYVRLGLQAARRERERGEARLREARLAERTAISRELHDLVAHHMSSMVLRLGVAKHVLPAKDDPRVDELLDGLHATSSAALADMRTLVEVLRAPGREPASIVVPEGLPAALDSVVEHGRGNGLDVSADVDPAIAGLDTVRGLAVLRLTQEGLANVVKHAGPLARVRLCVSLTEDGAVRMDMSNDGSGEPAHGDGYGLIGMRERVSLLGGRFDAGPTERGWRMSAVLP
ncbi:sensor histidine kinase [Streptosporangium lutulentum]|uniref:histidine kinase n=1 Tax=Streptosporangium lutulentum TaxID=1461250 RepID=A0ABT9QFH1_9ACTN|nr:histidine kinase [Streptosporangium lutulentum]MDP9845516.1 signal transduction histidine kinase [Streptosporangium lutulentum]